MTLPALVIGPSPLIAPPSIGVSFAVGYSMVLLAVAWGFDLMSKRVASRASGWRTGNFVYHEDHDAWLCPEDQWLWPTSFDPENRVMRYRGNPSICNACPVKDTCTTSSHGREVTREYDPWPFSEAGRFHRGLALMVAVLASLAPIGMLFYARSPLDLGILVLTAVVVIIATIPLARHLWHTPSGFPEHVSQEHVYLPIVTKDRYETSWGMREKS